MASQKPVKPVNPHHLTAKQLTADRSNLAKARAAAHVRPRTSKQKAASRHNLARARAVQKARRSGKKSVTAKKPQAPDSRETSASLHLLPACAPVALAEHLAFWTGAAVPADEIYTLHAKSSGQLTLADLIELVAAEGFAGMRLESFRSCDPGEVVPGWIYGIDHPAGYHAVLAHPAGMVSWGRLLRRVGTPREAWHLEWAPLS